MIWRLDKGKVGIKRPLSIECIKIKYLSILMGESWISNFQVLKTLLSPNGRPKTQVSLKGLSTNHSTTLRRDDTLWCRSKQLFTNGRSKNLSNPCRIAVQDGRNRTKNKNKKGGRREKGEKALSILSTCLLPKRLSLSLFQLCLPANQKKISPCHLCNQPTKKCPYCHVAPLPIKFCLLWLPKNGSFSGCQTK